MGDERTVLGWRGATVRQIADLVHTVVVGEGHDADVLLAGGFETGEDVDSPQRSIAPTRRELDLGLGQRMPDMAGSDGVSYADRTLDLAH